MKTVRKSAGGVTLGGVVLGVAVAVVARAGMTAIMRNVVAAREQQAWRDVFAEYYRMHSSGR